MKRLWNTLSRPVVWISLLCCFLLPFALSLFFREAPERDEIDFPAVRDELRAELARAETTLAETPDEEVMLRQRILFYETALRFELDVWSSEFYSEAASVYAEVMREWEILLADPDRRDSPRSRALGEMEAALCSILERRDEKAYLAFQKEQRLKEGKSEAEAERWILQASLRFAANANPGKQFYASEILLLHDSLSCGVNQYDPIRQGEATDENERARLEAIYAYRVAQLENERFDPVPANSETLEWGIEWMGLFLLILSLLIAKQEMSLREGLVTAVSLLPLFLLFSTLGILLTALIFAPQSLLPAPMAWQNGLIPIPFAIAVWCKLLLWCLPWLLFFPAVSALFERKSAALSVGVTLTAAALAKLLSLCLRLYLSSSPFRFAILFLYLDVKSLVFPDLPQALPVSEHLALNFLCYGAVLGLEWLLLRKKRL